MLRCSFVRPWLLLPALLLLLWPRLSLALTPIRYGDADGRFPGLPPLTVVKPGPDGAYAITLTEQLGLEYADEVVQYRLAGVPKIDAAGWRLLDEKQQPVPFQLEVMPNQPGAAHLVLLVDALPPGATRMFRLEKAPSTAQNPFRVSETDTAIELTNGIIGVRAPKSARLNPPLPSEQVPGPIQGMKGVGGAWLGKARLVNAGMIAAVESGVTLNGPVRAILSVRYTCEDPQYFYQLDLVMTARGNALRLVEQGKFPNTDGRLAIGFDDWQPDHGIRPNTFSQQVLHDRFGDKAVSQVALNNLRPYAGGGWYGLFKEGGRDFISIVPSLGGYWSPGYSVLVNSPEKGFPQVESWLNVDFHSFFLVFSDAAKAIRLDAVPKDALPARTEKPSEVKQQLTRTSPQGLMYFISSYQRQLLAGCCDPWYYRLTLNDMPLDKTKDWVLAHDDRNLRWPRLLGTRDDWPRIRLKTVPLLEEWQLRQRYLPLDFLVSDKPQTFGDLDHVRDHWEQSWRVDLTVQSVLFRGYAATPYVLTLGQAMHGGIRMTDTFKESLTPEQWREWKKWALVGGYILRDRDYWWYNWQQGFATRYLPNFNTCQWASLGLLGVILPNHPQSAEWLAFARESLEKEFTHHIDAEGVGQENPGNYFPFACDLFFPFIRAMQLNGVADYSTEPQFKNAVRYLINIQTPPDPRVGGKRIIPRIGHHPGAGAIISDLGGWAATMLQRSDPKLAAYAQWTWKQQGMKLAFNHDFPLGLYLDNPDLPSETPPLGSRRMGSLGFIFRNHFPSSEETYFIIKSGPISSHFQDDEGAFTFYAYGVPLACDGLDLSSSDDRAINHNVVSFDGAGGGRGDVKTFAATTVADYGVAELTGPRSYVRQILLVKGKTIEQPDYLVIYDHITSELAPQWNLDVHSEQPALFTGKPDNPEPGGLPGISFPGIRQPGCQVGLDCYVVLPDGVKIEPAQGVIDKNYVGYLGVKEHWYARIPAPAKSDFLVALLPFRQGKPHPTLRRLAGPHVIEVAYPGGRDLVFLSPTPIEYRDGEIRFTGCAGVLRLTGKETAAALLDGTLLQAGKTMLRGPKAGAVDGRK